MISSLPKQTYRAGTTNMCQPITVPNPVSRQCTLMYTGAGPAPPCLTRPCPRVLPSSFPSQYTTPSIRARTLANHGWPPRAPLPAPTTPPCPGLLLTPLLPCPPPSPAPRHPPLPQHRDPLYLMIQALPCQNHCRRRRQCNHLRPRLKNPLHSLLICPLTPPTQTPHLLPRSIPLCLSGSYTRPYNSLIAPSPVALVTAAPVEDSAKAPCTPS